MVQLLTRNWGWVVLRGAVAIGFGVLTLFYPGITLLALVLLFGAYALLDGGAMVFSAIANRHGEPRWLALLLGGIVGVAAGLVTLFLPGITAVALLALVAVWAILTGLAEIVAAVRLRKEITGEWLFVLSGVLAVLLGLILMAKPAVGALAMVIWIGAYAIASGIVLVAFGFRLRQWGREHQPGATPHPA